MTLQARMKVTQLSMILVFAWLNHAPGRCVRAMPTAGPYLSSMSDGMVTSSQHKSSGGDGGPVPRGPGVDKQPLDQSQLQAYFSHLDSYSMSVDELLKTWMSLSRGESCDVLSVIAPPNVREVSRRVRNGQVMIKVEKEDDVVNYFVTYQALDDTVNFALRSGMRTHIPLKNLPRDKVILVEIFALRRCVVHIFWSTSAYLQIMISKDDTVALVTPPTERPCGVPRPDMALQGKMSENSMTVNMKPEPNIDRYLITMDTKDIRQQSYVSNGPPGDGISGMTIGNLEPATMYKVTIIGETDCSDKAFHGAPIFFSVKTIDDLGVPPTEDLSQVIY